MKALALFALTALLLIAVIALASWGTTTAATALTLSATIATMQSTIALLSCALIAAIPLLLFGALRLGVLLGERNTTRSALPRDAMPVIHVLEQPKPLPLDASQIVMRLPAPQDPANAETFAPFRPTTVRRVRRTSHRTRAAQRVAKRWWK